MAKEAQAKAKKIDAKKTTKKTEKKAKTSHSSAYTNPAADMFKAFAAGINKPHAHKEAVMENHRKNLTAIQDANKMAVEVIKTIAQLQSQYVKQTFEDMNAMMREIMSSSSKPASAGNSKSHAEKIKTAMTRAFDHSTNVANVVAKSHQEIYHKMHDRFSETVDHMKDASKVKH